VIRLDGVEKRFGPRRTLDGLTLEVAEGEVFGLLGPLGAGKTTTLRILATLVRPDAGTATVGGVSVDHDPHGVRRLIGYLPETVGFYRRMTLREDLEFYAGVHGIPRVDRRSLAGDLLEVIGLADDRDREVADLDVGQRRRLGLARALVHDPAVLLLDEPTAGVEGKAREEVQALMVELAAMGKTILLTGRAVADGVCTSLGLLREGHLAVPGTVDLVV
jgi:ABC-2 type transport system ATP-binding protein